MTGRVARLSADLVANTTHFESGLARANRSMSRAKQSWNSDLNKAGKNFSQFETQVKSSIGSIVDLRTQLGGIAAVTASALSVQKVIQYSDTWKQLEGRLRIVEGNMQSVNKAQADLFEIAQRTRQPMEGIVSFYTRLKQFVPEAERAQYDFLGVTESVAAALAITGESGASSTAAMIQFTQAIGTNFESAGQEIRSLQEQAPRLTKALVDALGGGTKSLKQLQEEGVLTRKSVLDALGSMGTESKKLAAELAQIPLTVGQAVQRLDNAFLRFIGQTDAIKSGTGSLALGISLLAENFELLAKAVTGVAVVMGVRMLQSLGAVVTSMTVASYRTTLANAAMASLNLTATTTMTTMAGMGTTVAYSTVAINAMGFGARAAAVGVASLTAATRLLGGAITLLGGPIGVAIIGTLALMSQHTNAARDAQLALNSAIADHRTAAGEYITASDERRKAIEENTRANIENYKRELEAVLKIANALNEENAFYKFTRKIGAKLGIDTTAQEVGQVAAEIKDVIADLENDLANFEDQKGKPRPGSTGTGDKKDDKYQQILDSLKSESTELQLQIDLYGEKESAIARAQKALRIQQTLEKEGIKLTEEQQASIDQYLDSIERQTELQAEQAEQQKELEERERDRRQALNQLGATFESAFEKAITDGEKLSDVLNSLLDDILKLLTRTTITEPLGNVITDIFGNIGGSSGNSSGAGTSNTGAGGESIFSGIGSFFGDLFGGSFATGIDNVPRDMYAKLHRGEKVVTAADNRDDGAGDIIINVYDSDGNKQSSTREKQNGSGQIDIDLAIAENISRKGSKSSQAISGILNQSRIRR